jgi:hypothetical protein
MREQLPLRVSHHPGVSVAPTGQLPSMIGHRIYINLTKLMAEEIKDFLIACASGN